MPDFTLAMIWYSVFLFSTVCHEAAHALAAKLGGDWTAFHGGQVSLNPIPHIRREPFGMVVVPLLSFVSGGWMIGWASTPYNLAWARAHPKREVLMSLAGPAANLLLCLLALSIANIGLESGTFQVPSSLAYSRLITSNTAPIIAMVVSITLSLNLLLAVFNLIPLPPLDGSSLLTLILPPRLHAFVREPMVGMIGLLIAWKYFHVIFSPVFRFFLEHLYARTLSHA